MIIIFGFLQTRAVVRVDSWVLLQQMQLKQWILRLWTLWWHYLNLLWLSEPKWFHTFFTRGFGKHLSTFFLPFSDILSTKRPNEGIFDWFIADESDFKLHLPSFFTNSFRPLHLFCWNSDAAPLVEHLEADSRTLRYFSALLLGWVAFTVFTAVTFFTWEMKLQDVNFRTIPAAFLCGEASVRKSTLNFYQRRILKFKQFIYVENVFFSHF